LQQSLQPIQKELANVTEKLSTDVLMNILGNLGNIANSLTETVAHAMVTRVINSNLMKPQVIVEQEVVPEPTEEKLKSNENLLADVANLAISNPKEGTPAI
jgi:hypothetical protein